jgi:hypothetical protein
MGRLRWLGRDESDLVDRRILHTAVEQLRSRRWGALAEGHSPGGAPRLYILDIRGLFLAAGILRYTLAPYNVRVLYRGQTRDWEARAAIFRGVTCSADAQARSAWLGKVLDIIKDRFDIEGTSDAREALAQHYGLPSRWLDLVDNVQTACWFAYSDGRDEWDLAAGEVDDAVGYVHAFACPNDKVGLATAYDLREKPSTWLRPHIQQAWALRGGAPERHLGRLFRFQLVTFVVPRPLLRLWSGFDGISPRMFFPNEKEDTGLQYWRAATEDLTAQGLWPPPWL